MPNWRRGSTPPTNGSCSAPGSGSAISPPTASSPRIWRSMPRARRSTNAGIDAQSIDLIVLATSTPDNTFPATAVAVQHGLGINHGAAFDLQAVCSGFIFALATADNFLRSGAFKRALVIGAETFSRILDWNDRGTCVLFGDGAGAVVLEAPEQPGKSSDRGMLTTHLRSDGRHKSKLYVDGGPSSTQTVGHLRMEGREVFKHAVGMITDVIVDAFKATGITAEDIDWFVPHQANKQIIDASAHKLHIAPQKVVLTVDLHGNTSAASIPLALCGRGRRRAHQKGRSGALGSHGRRLHLGFGVDPLVSADRLVHEFCCCFTCHALMSAVDRRMLSS